jgi:hypothetical protein
VEAGTASVRRRRVSRATVTAVLAAVLRATVAHVQSPPLVTDLGLLPGDADVAAAVNSQLEATIARGGDQYLVVWSD